MGESGGVRNSQLADSSWRIPVEVLTLCGDEGSPPRSGEQPHLQPFQILQRMADCRLGQVKPTRCLSEAAFLDERAKGKKLATVECFNHESN